MPPPPPRIPTPIPPTAPYKFPHIVCLSDRLQENMPHRCRGIPASEPGVRPMRTLKLPPRTSKSTTEDPHYHSPRDNSVKRMRRDPLALISSQEDAESLNALSRAISDADGGEEDISFKSFADRTMVAPFDTVIYRPKSKSDDSPHVRSSKSKSQIITNNDPTIRGPRSTPCTPVKLPKGGPMQSGSRYISENDPTIRASKSKSGLSDTKSASKRKVCCSLPPRLGVICSSTSLLIINRNLLDLLSQTKMYCALRVLRMHHRQVPRQ